MNILTEKEREDVYKYWLHSSTLTNEDGLIQLAERAVLEKLAGMALPRPLYRDDTEHGKDYYTADQLHQACAQGAASQLSQVPFGIWHVGDTEEESDFYVYEDSGDVSCENCIKLYTLKEAK